MTRKANVENNMEKNSKIYNIKNVIIFLLLLLTIALFLYTIFFSRDTKNRNEINKFIQNINEVQTKLSYYLGKTSTDMFDAYSVEQIVTGVSDINKPQDTPIKNNNGDLLTPLVGTSASSIEKKDSKSSYLVVENNLKKVLNIDLNSYIEIRYYINQDGIIKVKLDTVPSWWDESLDSYKLGK